MNDVLFSVIMRQEKYCKPLLEFILGIKIKKSFTPTTKRQSPPLYLQQKVFVLMFTLRTKLERSMTLKFKPRINIMWAKEPVIIRA